MNSKLNYIIPVLLVFSLLEGCKKLPEYSTTPYIEFEGFEVFRNRLNPYSLTSEDSVVIMINFQDGDGDLGMSDSDKKNDSLPNFVMRSYVKNNSPFVDSVVTLGQFQPLTLSAKEVKGPIQGTLRFVKSFSYSDYSPKDSIRFEIYIKDRAGNISNTVLSDTLVVNKN